LISAIPLFPPHSFSDTDRLGIENKPGICSRYALLKGLFEFFRFLTDLSGPGLALMKSDMVAYGELHHA
jgi:hypothetical protein